MTSRVLSCICIIAWALLAAPALAQQPPPPPQEPILRIDPGMHTAPIRSAGVDGACALMATGSDDKTLRLWGLPDGKLLRTLRPPIGPGNDGKIYAVAVAPDGSWAAAGGWDAAYSSKAGIFVYVFQTATGVLLARLGPEGDVVNRLAVSADGRFLAATIHGGLGVRVWERTGVDLASWRLAAEDREYDGAAAYGVAFDSAGALYTVAYDGKLRRYAPGFKAKPTLTATRGKEPYSVAAHPSADSVAVGHFDTKAVDVYETATLARRFAADTRGKDNGNLASVAWSADGARLYAGGNYPLDRNSSVLVWGRRGKGLARELDGPRDTIMQLLPCGDRMAIAAQDPVFGLLTPQGTRQLWQEGVQADLRGQVREDGLSAAANGHRLRFGLQAAGKSPVLFDLMAEQLVEAPDRPSDLAGPDTTSLPVTGWNNMRDPKLAGTPIQLEALEIARSFAVAPDKQHFVLGAEWSLRGYRRDGTLLWQKQVPGIAWGANVSRDGRLAIAAYGDGTIRWHRLTDGQELLALFVHAKDRRWVAWTPKGYYMASPGAESLIGWHVNRGWSEAAQFFPVDRFREQFNRPDIVKLALETLDEPKAIEEANKRGNRTRGVEDVRTIAPPMVVIQKPGDGSSFRTPEVTLEYDILAPTGQKITKVDYLINNAALGARFAGPVSTGKYASGRVTLPLPPEDVTITLVARDEGNRTSEPVSVRLRWDGAKPGQVVLPRLRGLFVGVNAYTSPRLTKLDFAAKDATDLAAFFNAQQAKSYSKVEVKLLPNAKRADVLDGLEWLEKGSEEGDVNLLFLAGHGATIDQNFYYMAADSDPDRARATAVNRDEILSTIRNRKGAMVVMLDACHSGATADAPPAGGSRVDMNRLANELGDKSLGVLLYASARGRQFSYERAEWANGAFTRAMLDGLGGAADRDRVGYVDTEELSVYVRRRVMTMTKGLQEPVRVKPDAAPEMRIVLLK